MPSSVKNRKAPPRSGEQLELNKSSSFGVTSPANSPTAKSSKQRRHRKQQASPLKICAGLFLSIFLLVFIAYFDFQQEEKLNRKQQAKLAATSQGQHIHQQQEGPQRLRKTVKTEHSCLYDGNCPVRSICAVPPNNEQHNGQQLGVCQPFASLGQSAAPPACVDTCLRELRIDEHFYQERWAELEWSETVPASGGRPAGCLLVYHRTPDHEWAELRERDRGDHSRDVPPSIHDWVANRFHHVHRVDPLNDEEEPSKKWMALCTNPCTRDADCATPNDHATTPGFTCQDGACRRNPGYWIQDTHHSDMVLVTGANSAYHGGLLNLAASARYWAPNHKMVIYNLGGLSAAQLAELEGMSNVLSVEWKDGIPKHYPAHVHVGKQYAWKPIIVNETVHKYKAIFWLDAGSTLAGPVEPMETVIRNQGIGLVKGQDLQMKLSHEKTYQWFGRNKHTMETGPHFSGNTQAFLHPSRYTEMVVLPNARCALDVNCIAPPGSMLQNHRYDQTTISILAYATNVKLPHYTEYLAASQSQLNPDLSQPSFKFVWTSRQSCTYYMAKESREKMQF